MIKNIKFHLFFLLSILLFYACNNAFYNPFIENTFTDDPENTATPDVTAGSTLDPTLDPTPEPTPDTTPVNSNETPESAEVVILDGGSALINADSTEASKAVELSGDAGSCIDHSTSGNDLFYSIILNAGDTIEITVSPTSSWDPAIYLITDSADPEGSCVAGADDEMSGTPETIIYSVPAGEGGIYIIGVDCFYSIVTTGGPFDMNILVY